MHSFDVHYYDRDGNHRIFCTYARDVLHARQITEELVDSKTLARITGIIPVDNFDW